MSFSLSQDTPQVIDAFLWRQPGSIAEQRFEKSTKSFLLDLPLEMLNRVVHLVLTTDTYLSGTIHLHEEKKRFVFAESKVAPNGQAMEKKRWEGYPRDLPQRFNQVQYTCQFLWEQYRGAEVAHNTVVCHGFTFDSFREEIGRPELSALVAKLKRIVLFGQFTLKDCPEERLLHGLLKLGKDHPRVQVRVEVDDMRLTRARQLQPFVTWALCIRKAIRGVPQPALASVRHDRVEQWRRGKPASTLNVSDVRFFPYREPSVADHAYFNVQQVTAMVKKSTGKLVQKLLNNLKVEGDLVDLIQDPAVHSQADLDALRKMTGTDACFELIKHCFTKGV